MRPTMLCEACGYAIEGLDDDGPCPECGLAVGASAPSQRPGTPWQRGPGALAWAKTLWALARRPRRTFRAMRIEPGSGTPLAAVNVAIAAALLVVPWTGTLIGDPARGVRGSGAAAEALTHGWVFAAQTAAVGTILAALTGLECLGILFVAARRGWRPTRAGAWQICCHATAGWILCGLLPLLALAGMFSAVVLFRAAPGGVLDLRPVVRTPLEWGVIVSGGSLMAGYLGGFLAFQGLVAVGVRRCRYANAPGEGAETPGREAGLPEGGAGSLREPVGAA